MYQMTALMIEVGNNSRGGGLGGVRDKRIQKSFAEGKEKIYVFLPTQPHGQYEYTWHLQY